MNVAGEKLDLSPTNELSSSKGDMKGYDYFTDKMAISYSRDFRTRFNIRLEKQEDVLMDLWMKGYPGRTVFTTKAPPSNALVKGSIPDELLNRPLPTLIVRQEGEAWTRPFVSVFYPHSTAEAQTIASVDFFGERNDFAGIIVKSVQRTDYIFNSTDEQTLITYQDMHFQGDYAVVGMNGDSPELLFLGNGKTIRKGNWCITAENKIVNLSLCKKKDLWKIDASDAARLVIPAKTPPQITKIAGSGEKINIEAQADGTFLIILEKGKYQLKQL